MSSSSYIHPKKPIQLKDWLEFCIANNIEYSPKNIGRNVYYYGGLGGVEIKFGDSNYETNEPPEIAKRIVVSSFFMQNLFDICKITSYILARWSSSHVAAPEVKQAMKLYKNSSQKLLKLKSKQ